MIQLKPESLATIFSHASQRYPEECCGFVYANGIVHRGTNIQNELHACNPQTYDRDARIGYTFSVADTIALNKSMATDNPAAIIYHSHPDVGAYFSAEDGEKALFLGEPIYPVQYLVVAVTNGRPIEAKTFSWEKNKFTCIHTYQP